jgi:AbrB family looped-hinge helix DNA binding protein
MQESVVSVRGQTVIPKEVREALGIKEGSKLRWRLRDGAVMVVPASHDPVRALRGVLKGKGSTEDLLRERREERDKEEREIEEDIKRRHGKLPPDYFRKPTEEEVMEVVKRWRSSR